MNKYHYMFNCTILDQQDPPFRNDPTEHEQSIDRVQVNMYRFLYLLVFVFYQGGILRIME